MCQRNRRLFRYSLIVFLLIVVLAACQNEDVPDVVVRVTETAVSTPTAQPTATPTFTPSPMPTQTKTAVPTNTSTPSPTLTPTPTRFSELLLTPEAPPTDETAYRLVPWSPDHAHNLSLLMEENFKDVMAHYFSFDDYSFLRYAASSYAEAQLKYPIDPRVNQWMWAETYNHVVSKKYGSNDPFISHLINQLNAGEISFNETELQEWFHEYPSYFEFEIQVDFLPPVSGFLSSHIVTITSSYILGGTTFWVLETDDGYFAYPFYSNLGSGFSSSYNWEIVDLTGDENEDLLISATLHSGTFIGEDLTVFDLSYFPPNQLSFAPEKSSTLELSHSSTILF